ncbi:hypothetical protein D3C87_144280 [compost metagenome]
MTKIGSFLFSFFILFFAVSASAAVTVQSSVDRNEMALGDTFTLVVTVLSTESVDIQEPRIPEIDGFDLLNNWQSTAVAQKLVQGASGMQFETQRRKEFHYMLSPKVQGQLSVSSFEVVVDGKVYRTQPILVKVGAQGSAQTQPRQRTRPQPGMPQMPPGFGSFDDMDQAEEEIFNSLLQQRQRLLQQGAGLPDQHGGGGSGMADPAFRSLPTNPNEAFFIQVEVDKTEVYEGEQVTVNWYVYTRGQMETLDRLKFPSLRGFWKEIIEEVPSIQFSEEIVNGIPYKKALLASHALFPIKPGTAVIDEYKIKSRIRLPTNGYGGYFGKAYEFTKSSKTVEIKVKPLPVEGRPSDFTGAVGQFEVSAGVEQPNIPVNQPVSMRVRFEGAGNAKLIDLPAINWPNGIEVYDTKSDSKFFKNGRSYKEFEVLLIPRQEGEVTIPALSFSGFDPQTRKYYTRHTEPTKLVVGANPNAPVGSSQRISGDATPAPVKTIREDVLPDVIQAWEPSSKAMVWAHPGAWVALYGGIVIGLLIKMQREFGWGRRRRTLKELVNKRYKKVDTALASGNFRAVGAEMTNIFYVVLGEIAGSGGASLEIDRLLELIPPSLRRAHGDEIKKSFEVFQTVSFAPEEMLGKLKDPGTMKDNYNQAKKILSSVIASTEEK